MLLVWIYHSFKLIQRTTKRFMWKSKKKITSVEAWIKGFVGMQSVFESLFENSSLRYMSIVQLLNQKNLQAAKSDVPCPSRNL